MGEAKSLGFKKRALLELDEAELVSRLEQIAGAVEVPLEQAKQMAAIQPNLLLEPKVSCCLSVTGLLYLSCAAFWRLARVASAHQHLSSPTNLNTPTKTLT